MLGIQYIGSYLELKVIIDIQDIVRHVGYLSISVEYGIRKYTFLDKLQYSNNQVLVKLHSMSAKQKLHMLDLSYNVLVGSSCVKLKRLIKDRFLQA